MQTPDTDIHQTIAQVEASEEFKQFNATNPHHYLVHVFTTATTEPGPLELGYYGKETDKITVFKTNPILMTPPEEVFKEQGVLAPLDLGCVLFGSVEALAKANKYREQGYPHHQAMKTICILQQSEHPVWNMTIITNTLHMINMKIDAMTGQMLSREMRSIMDLAT